MASQATNAAALDLINKAINESETFPVSYTASNKTHDFEVTIVRREKGRTKLAKRLNDQWIAGAPEGQDCPTCGGSGRI